MKEKEDMFYSAKKLDNALGLLRKSKKLKEKDKRAIRAFVENLKARRVSTSRIAVTYTTFGPSGKTSAQRLKLQRERTLLASEAKLVPE